MSDFVISPQARRRACQLLGLPDDARLTRAQFAEAALVEARLPDLPRRLAALHFPSGMGHPEWADPRRWCHHCRDADGTSMPWPCPTARIAGIADWSR